MKGKLNMVDTCPVLESKDGTASRLISNAIEEIKNRRKKKINLIWLEACGCSGNIISLLNGDAPDVKYFLNEMVDLRYDNSLSQEQGEDAFQNFIDTLGTEFVLVVEGAVSLNAGGAYNIIARYKDRLISGAEAVKMAGEKAKHIIAAGTCASYGGISAAKPNPSGSTSVGEYLGKKVINVPGCPSHPDWVMGTIADLILFNNIDLDSDNRPIVFYGVTIHDFCTRRSFFDNKIFAKSLGDKECMFKLGCRGPITRTDCPTRRWNENTNWPVGGNTPCIGCARKGFPDAMEPFITT